MCFYLVYYSFYGCTSHFLYKFQKKTKTEKLVGGMNVGLNNEFASQNPKFNMPCTYHAYASAVTATKHNRLSLCNLVRLSLCNLSDSINFYYITMYWYFIQQAKVVHIQDLHDCLKHCTIKINLLIQWLHLGSTCVTCATVTSGGR